MLRDPGGKLASVNFEPASKDKPGQKAFRTGNDRRRHHHHRHRRIGHVGIVLGPSRARKECRYRAGTGALASGGTNGQRNGVGEHK